MERPTFYIDGDKTKPVRAGGVIIYKYVKNELFMLLIDSRGQYEDIGGRTDYDDDDYFDTVVREVYEETNKIIKRKNTRDKIMATTQKVYIPVSKYVIFFIEATEKQKKLKKKDFGPKEIHDDIFRTINWISHSHFTEKNIINYKINFRLKNKHVFEMLNCIKINKQMQHKIKTDSESQQ